jgi:uncharacterized protein
LLVDRHRRGTVGHCSLFNRMIEYLIMRRASRTELTVPRSTPTMNHFTPLASTLGGAIIGLAASLLLVLNGRQAGVSGIVAGTLRPKAGEFLWRALFVLGLLAGGALMGWLQPGSFQAAPRGLAVVAVAGALVGFGSQLGGGCTSGHGICGICRLSKRSLVATATFMAAGALTVFVTTHMSGAVR